MSIVFASVYTQLKSSKHKFPFLCSVPYNIFLSFIYNSIVFNSILYLLANWWLWLSGLIFWRTGGAHTWKLFPRWHHFLCTTLSNALKSFNRLACLCYSSALKSFAYPFLRGLSYRVVLKYVVLKHCVIVSPLRHLHI